MQTYLSNKTAIFTTFIILFLVSYNISLITEIKSITTAIFNKTSNKFDFKIFPNPITDFITIWHDFKESAKVQYNVIDMSGKTILSNEVNAEYKINIDCSSLSKGMYTVQLLMSNGEVGVQKFLKQ